MMTSVEGVYRDGRIELNEPPKDVHGPTPVIVTLLNSGGVDLRERGISESQAAELRERFAAFGEDWNRPEMDLYDNYDAAKSKL